MEAVAEDATVEPPQTLQSRPSWIRRLSAMSMSGNSTPSSTGSRPASASMSFSAGSTNFSRAGSTVPMFGEPQQPLPRNKLIKRSASVRGPNGFQSLEGSSRFQRPLTSHDRIRTLRERPSSAMLEPLDWSDSQASSKREQHHRPRWRHYFTAKSTDTPSETLQSASVRDGRPVKRLFPDEQSKPFLLMAESIVTTAVEVDNTMRMSQDADSLMFGSSRPMTPAGFDGNLSSQISTAASKRSRPEPSTGADVQHPRRSFSISDLLSRGPSGDKPRKSIPFGDRLLRKRTLRASSAPTRLIFSEQPKQSIELQHDRERPAKRRDSDATSPPAPPSSGSYASNDFHLPTASPLSPLKPPTPPKNVSSTFLVSESPVIPEESASSPVEHYTVTAKIPSALKSSRHRVRHSVTHSEHASTIGGSDYNDKGLSSGDDDDTDMTSDTMFDSIRTHGTRSTSGVNVRGGRIETIFDESPPPKDTQLSLRQLHEQGTPDNVLRDLDIEARSWPESETISTPTAKVTTRHSRRESSPLPSTPPMSSHAHQGPPISPQFHSSPPKMDRFNVQQLERKARQDDSDEEMWNVDDSTSERDDDTSGLEDEDEDESHEYERVATPLSLHRSNPVLVETSGSSSTAATPVNLAVAQPPNNRDSVSRSSVFDWSEPTGTSIGSNTPPRPKTVHGKKASGKRGSRAGRRAPSGLHVRSQSVPVVPDLANPRKENLSAKFGTWNAGKGATEDWDDDFDFEEPPPRETSEELDEKRIDSGFSMYIPKSIRDQQGSMQQNRKLITDMYHYAGALRDLQRHAIHLEMLEGEHEELFQLVDAIIALADEESEELGPGNFSPPSSPGFDADAFEENPKGVKDRIKQKPGRSTSARYSEPSAHTSAANSKLRRKSVLPPNDSLIFTPPTASPHATVSEHGSSPSARLPETPKSSRSRKDSVARAKLVIERFQGQSHITHTIDEQSDETKGKLAFDTATLRSLVPFVKEVVDKAKAAVREREALYRSPDGSPQAPAEPEFTTVFRELPPDGSPSNRPRRIRASPPHEGVENDLTQKFKLMTVV